jgi:type II secretory pathway pseudopilin PulG
MSRRSPFTVIELLAVMVIVAILAGLILGVSRYASAKGHDSKTLSQLLALEDALGQFQEDRGYNMSTNALTNDILQLGSHFPAADVNPIGTVATTDPCYRFTSGRFVHSQTGNPYIPGYNGGPYLDAWKRPFLYRCDGNQNNTSTFDIWSAGRDGVIGTDDDITNWKRNN